LAQTLTTTVSNVTANTFNARRKELTDTIFTFYPAFSLLKEQNQIKWVEGGQCCEFVLAMAKNNAVTFIGRGGTVSLAETEFTRVAQYDWAKIVANMTIFHDDLRMNRGEGKIGDIAAQLLDVTFQSIADQLEESLWGNPPASTGIVLNGIDDLIRTTDAASAAITTGAIVRNADYWYNNAVSMTGESATLRLVDRMMTMMNTCARKGGGVLKGGKVGTPQRLRFPNIILTSQTVYEYFEREYLEYTTITNKAIDDLGYGGLKYKGATVAWSPAADNDAQKMYFINSNNFGIHIDSFANMQMTSWKEATNQPEDKFAQIVGYLQLGCDCLPNQGVLYLIDTE
jgi:hypothetical protein